MSRAIIAGVGALILQLFVVQAPPPPSQAEAVRILLASPGLSNVARWRVPTPTAGPQVTFSGATEPTLGPWAWPTPRPAIRLDGSPLWLPPAVYGGIPYPWFGGPFPVTVGGCQKCNRPDSGQKPPDRELARPVQ